MTASRAVVAPEHQTWNIDLEDSHWNIASSALALSITLPIPPH